MKVLWSPMQDKIEKLMLNAEIWVFYKLKTKTSGKG